MKNVWFKGVGWIYLPVSLPGVIIALIALFFCAQAFVAVGRNSHSVRDALYGVFPFYACVFLLFDWVASRTSKQ